MAAANWKPVALKGPDRSQHAVELKTTGSSMDTQLAKLTMHVTATDKVGILCDVPLETRARFSRGQ